MKIIKLNFLLFSFMFLQLPLSAQTSNESMTSKGHTNKNKFKQLKEELATPNSYRTASGAPGIDYYQQKVDYVMDIELDDKNKRVYGEEMITYTNNSPDELSYLWLQLDQNIRKKNSPTLLKNTEGEGATSNINDLIKENEVNSFVSKYIKEKFDGGFNISFVKDESGNHLDYTINMTMMRIDLPKPIKTGEQLKFSIKWWYNINNHVENRARSGYEYFPKDDNRLYVIAQFFPRLAVYNDVEGWQNHQFWGNGEFALNFGDYEVNIKVPDDHILDATGVLQNPKEVLSKEQYRRYKFAQTQTESPVFIVNQIEAEENEKGFSSKKKFWKFKAYNVRDFAFATSRKFIWEMMAVPIGGKNIMAVSMYPKEGNPLWEEFSTKAVVQALKTYSKYTFNYPYPKAVSVHSKNQGMEYPMICWNPGRPDIDGSYSLSVKYRMIYVIIHEIGHNFFPMIVNSDERQWGWMDEGINSFVQYLTEQEFGRKYLHLMDGFPGFPSSSGEPSQIVRYMSGDQSIIAPIMSNPENVYQLGPNAYDKPATALNILRETVMGRDLFDHAFKTYAQRWMFKHPTPTDFFRTMEDASAVDLDWFWRGWFYTTDYVDIGVKEVKKLTFTDQPSGKAKEILENYQYLLDRYDLVFLSESLIEEEEMSLGVANSKSLNKIINDNSFNLPKNIYQVTFNKPGGLVMPVLVDYHFSDGSVQRVNYPAEVWRKNDDEVSKLITTNKELLRVELDPDEMTADINKENNTWPKTNEMSEFDQFKAKINN